MITMAKNLRDLPSFQICLDFCWSVHVRGWANTQFPIAVVPEWVQTLVCFYDRMLSSTVYLLNFFSIELICDAARLEFIRKGSVSQASIVITSGCIKIFLSQNQRVIISSCNLCDLFSPKLGSDVSWRRNLLNLAVSDPQLPIFISAKCK